MIIFCLTFFSLGFVSITGPKFGFDWLNWFNRHSYRLAFSEWTWKTKTKYSILLKCMLPTSNQTPPHQVDSIFNSTLVEAMLASEKNQAINILWIVMSYCNLFLLRQLCNDGEKWRRKFHLSILHSTFSFDFGLSNCWAIWPLGSFQLRFRFWLEAEGFDSDIKSWVILN